MKKCRLCNIEKPISRYYIDKRKDKGDVRTECIECSKKEAQKYHKTISGVIGSIYSSQKKASKKRNHQQPDYSRKDIYNKSINSKIFMNLYYEWVASGYKKDDKPSYDRLDNKKPYTFDNLRIVKWIENNEEGYKEVKNGYGKLNKPVEGVNVKTGEIVNYASATIAGKTLSINSNAIRQICRGVKWRNTAGGFIWKYKLKNYDTY